MFSVFTHQRNSMAHMTTLIGRSFASIPKGGFFFPKHRELLTEDFYDDKEHDNPYSKQMEGDTESYS